MTDIPLPDLGNLTATGVLGWYAWYTASRTIPALVQAFREEMQALRNERRDERQSFERELAEQRVQHHADHLALVEALNGLAQRTHA